MLHSSDRILLYLSNIQDPVGYTSRIDGVLSLIPKAFYNTRSILVDPISVSDGAPIAIGV